MGIPQYFGWLSRKYKTDIISTKPIQVDHLFFDFNCLIYHCYAQLDYDLLIKKTVQDRQRHLIEEVLKYTKYIVTDVVKPKKSTSICIDGVVPMAKMHQQRLRRYKSPLMKEWENEIKRRFGVYKEELLDTNQITPGTPFMGALCDELEAAIKRRYFGSLDVSFSGANSPGEGEHKVMNMIRTRRIPRTEKVCIYGLDADLIMLSLTLDENEVVLVRENMHVGRGEMRDVEFVYVNVESLGNLIFEEIRSKIIEKMRNGVSNLQKNRVIKDYVFLGFLLGNDFLHSVPSLSIMHDGVDFVINIYAACYAESSRYMLVTVNQRTRISNEFLKKIFENLKRSEESNLKYLQQKKGLPRLPNFDDHYSEAIWKWNRVPYNEKFKECYQVIDYANPGWKKKYYKLFFDFNYDDENDRVNLAQVCQNYFEGILFVVKYYFDSDASWYWYNPYPVCAFASDLSDYFSSVTDINSIVVERGTPFTPFEQLMMVMPKTSSSYLPRSLASEMVDGSLVRFYPDEFEWVAWDKVMLYSIEPKLPLIDIESVRIVVRSKLSDLTEEERRRNIVV